MLHDSRVVDVVRHKAQHENFHLAFSCYCAKQSEINQIITEAVKYQIPVDGVLIAVVQNISEHHSFPTFHNPTNLFSAKFGK